VIIHYIFKVVENQRPAKEYIIFPACPAGTWVLLPMQKFEQNKLSFVFKVPFHNSGLARN
jgi:hypothetical protein